MRSLHFSLAALGTVLLGLPLAPVNGQDLSRLGGKRDLVPISTACSDARSAGSRGAVALQHPAFAAQIRGAATADSPARVASSASAGAVVWPSETLYGFARRNNVQIGALIEANRLVPPYVLRPGQQLIVPHARVHTVQPGETVYSIARQDGIDLSALLRANNIQPPYRIAPAQILILPDRTVTTSATTTPVSAEGIDRVERLRPSAAAIVSAIVTPSAAPAMPGRLVTAPASTPPSSAGDIQPVERPWSSASAVVSAILSPSTRLAAWSAAPPARMAAAPASLSVGRVNVVPPPTPVLHQPPLTAASANARLPNRGVVPAVGAAAMPIAAAPPPPPALLASSATVPPVPTLPPSSRQAGEPLKGTNAPAVPPFEAKIAAFLSPSAGNVGAVSAARSAAPPPRMAAMPALPVGKVDVLALPPPVLRQPPKTTANADAAPPNMGFTPAVGTPAAPIAAAPPLPPSLPASSATLPPVPTPPPSSRQADERLKGAPAEPASDAKIAAFSSPSVGDRGAVDSVARAGRFLWPIRGKIVSGFGAKESGIVNEGINIAAALGQTVVAADDGVVVYSGNEIRGYGYLLLIKHAKNWITAYGHNDVLLVARGEHVHRGQPIAKAGKTGDVLSPQLHFEIRHGARAVDPLKLVAHG